MKSLAEAILNRLWLAVVLAFVVLITAWTTFIVIAVKHQPAEIPIAVEEEK